MTVTEKSTNGSNRTRIGSDAQAYVDRPKYSPEPIRDALWRIVGNEISGIVLDAGSGDGGWCERLQASGRLERIICVDLNAGTRFPPGVEFHTGDLTTDPLPCPTGGLDWIFAIEVLEHLANPRHFLFEAFRCLKTGGRIAITTPCNECITAKLSFMFRGYFPAFCDLAYETTGHITPITELDLCRISKEAGFNEVKFAYPLPGRMPKLSYPWQKFLPFLRGRNWSDTLIAVLTK